MRPPSLSGNLAHSLATLALSQPKMNDYHEDSLLLLLVLAMNEMSAANERASLTFGQVGVRAPYRTARILILICARANLCELVHLTVQLSVC